MPIGIQQSYGSQSKSLTELTRPRFLSELIGQSHLIGEGGVLTPSLDSALIPSLIFFGPPGSGKTTVATLIAQRYNYEFVAIKETEHALSGLKGICATIERRNLRRPRHDPVRIVVFIDEVHRFSKTQQDFLLPYVELGIFSFIGATTVEPRLRLCRALLSRCRIVEFERLSNEELKRVVVRALERQNVERSKHHQLPSLILSPTSVERIATFCDGDARRAVKLVEIIGFQYRDTTKEAIEVDEDLVLTFITKTGIKLDLMVTQHSLLKKLCDIMNNAYDIRPKADAKAHDASMLSCYDRKGPASSGIENLESSELLSEQSFSYCFSSSDSSDDEHNGRPEMMMTSVNNERTQPLEREAAHEHLKQSAIRASRELLASGLDPLKVMKQVVLAVLRHSGGNDLDLTWMMLLVRGCRDGRGTEVELLISTAFDRMGSELLSLALQLRAMKSCFGKNETVSPNSVIFDNGLGTNSTDAFQESKHETVPPHFYPPSTKRRKRGATPPSSPVSVTQTD